MALPDERVAEIAETIFAGASRINTVDPPEEVGEYSLYTSTDIRNATPDGIVNIAQRTDEDELRSDGRRWQSLSAFLRKGPFTDLHEEVEYGNERTDDRRAVQAVVMSLLIGRSGGNNG